MSILGSIFDGGGGAALPFYSITSTSIADHGNPATSGSVAWAIAQINSKATVAERRGIIQIGAGVFNFDTKITTAANITLVGSGCGVTYLNFNDVDGGIEFNQGDLYVGSATYAVGDYVTPSTGAWPHAVKFRCTSGGVGSAAATFTTDATSNVAVGSTFISGGCSWLTEANTPQTFGDFAYEMASGMTGKGILAARNNGFTCRDLSAFGGSATAWALEVDSCNKFKTGKIDFEIDSNGILFTIRNPTVTPYNYGDGSLQGVDITLSAANTVGLKYLGSSTSIHKINNISVDRAEIVGSGDVTDCQVGVWFENASRNTINHIDIELINVGIMELGDSFGNANDSQAINEFHFIPNPGTQTTEAYPYARGVPFQAAGSGSSVPVRENWLNYSAFSAWPGGGGTYYIADDDGSYNRDVTAVGAPAAGIRTMTLASAVPSSGTGGLTRYPCIAPNSNFPSNFSLKAGTSVRSGQTQLPGDDLMWGQRAAYGFQSLTARCLGYGILAFRKIRGTADGIKINVDTNEISSEATTKPVRVSSLVAGSPLAAAPSTTFPGMIVQADGVGWNPGSGAGTYLRNAANSAWVFLG
jgi:hypothetical protein